jgi:hypothetical protein
MSTNFLFAKQHPTIFCLLHLEQTFPPTILIFTKGEVDGIKSSLK